MEQDNRNYNYEDDYEYENTSDKSLKGYKMVIVLLVIILAGVSGLYFMQTKQLKADFAIERDTLTNQLSVIRNDFDNLKTTNDTICFIAIKYVIFSPQRYKKSRKKIPQR
jgi:hypothetical protein